MSITLPEVKVVFADGGVRVRGGASLIEGVGIRPAFVIPDARGRLGSILRCDDPWFDQLGQVYFSTAYPGVVKAWHCHRKQTNFFYVIQGAAKIGLHDVRDGSPTRGEVNELVLSEHSPGLLRIPPGVQHGWMCVSTVEAIVLNLSDRPYNADQPDDFRSPPHDNEIPFDWTVRDA